MSSDEERYAEHRLDLAREVVSVVLNDLHRTTDRRPNVELDLVLGAIRIQVDGNFTTPSMFAVDHAAALAEVASYMQEQLSENAWMWPVCETHDVGLHAEVHNAKAVWWCNLGQHERARIGELQ